MRLQLRCWPGLQLLKVWQAGRSTSHMAHSCGCEAIVGFWQEASILPSVDLSINSLTVLSVWQLASPRVSNVRERVETAMWFMTSPGKLYSITSTVSYLSHNSVYSVWEGMRKDMNSERQGSPMLFWRLASTVSICLFDHFIIILA